MAQHWDMEFDVVVVGGGHAGCEAAAAAARLGARTLCSPTTPPRSARCRATRPSAGWPRAIWCARSTRSTASWAARSIGPASSSACSTAARGRRCAGRGRRPTASSTARRCQAMLGRAAGPRHRRRRGEDLLLDAAAGSAASRSATAGRSPPAAVVLTTGTFLSGLIHIGDGEDPGRAARRRGAVARAVAHARAALGFALGRLKTGTPPRLDGRTIDWAGAGGAAGRRPARALLVPDRPDHDAAGRLPHHRDDAGERTP